jgi:2,4-dienoyl-CoA reductase-like NADH-dependent reductase (Old Yellow Enzyme family)
MSSAGSLAAEPFTLRGLELRNRIVGTAHAPGIVERGVPLPADADYWRRRAAGGAAMLTVGGSVTAPESTWRGRITTETWREEAIAGMALRARAIREEGAVAAAQIVHLGRETLGAETWYHPVAPSAVRSPREPTRPRPLGDDEIDAVVEGFRVSAVNVAEAGYQVVELHAAHGYLLAQFLSPMSNVRPDAGSVEGRLAVVARVAAEIRASAPGLVLGIRLSTEGAEEAGLSLEGLCELLPHVCSLVDYVNLTVGVRATYVKDMATDSPPLLGEVGRLRPLVDRPLLVSQAFRRGAEIEAALAAGADLVGMARPLIADPDMPRKLLSGREREVRPCVSCNEDCRAFDPALLCSVNPELGPPGEARRPAHPLLVRGPSGPGGGRASVDAGGAAGLESASGARAGAGDTAGLESAGGGRVAIVGAGPAGLESAGGGRVAIVGAGPAGLECATTLAGSRPVTLFDERDAIGGQLAVAAAAPNRSGWRRLLDFYAAALDAAEDITVELGRRVAADDLGDFDDVVLAVGSTEELPELPGIERALTVSRAIALGADALAGGGVPGDPATTPGVGADVPAGREDLLGGADAPAGRADLLGADAPAGGGALLVVDDGFGWWPCASAVELGIRAGFTSITIATPGAAFGATLPPEGRVQLLARLRGTPLAVRPFTALAAVGERSAELRNTMAGTTEEIAADTVIVVGERRARDWSGLVPASASVRVIGDALVPRKVAHAISEGRAVAEALVPAAAPAVA